VSKIEIGRYSEQLRRMFGMKGQETVSSELSPEVSPTIQLEGPGAEWNFLKQVRDCAFGNTVIGAVGFTTKWRFRNPVDSGIIAVMEAWELTPTLLAGMSINGNAQTVDLPTASIAAVTDGRWGTITASRPTVIVSSSNAQATGPAGESFAEAVRLGSTAWLYDQEIVLVPGAVLDIGLVSTNIDARIWARWRERQIPALEL